MSPGNVLAMRLHPDAETGRLAALVGYGILDTPPEPAFDDVVSLATTICGTPVALVSFVDRNRQWFKARKGFPRCETTLGESVCSLALDSHEILEIEDLAADSRTASNPLVRSDPRIRFYAGAPLVTPDGHVLGTLCVIDGRPRPGGLNQVQRDSLRSLARQVMSLLSLRTAVHQRDELLVRQELRRQEAEALSQARHAIWDAAGDLDLILAAVLDAAMATFPNAEGGAVELLDGDELEYRAVRGTISRCHGLRISTEGTLAGRCIRAGRPLRFNDAWEEDHPRPDLLRHMGVRSTVLAPIVRGDRVLGVLKLHAGRPGLFTDEDLDRVERFASAASVGLTEASEVAANRARAESETRYRAIFESAIDYAIVVMDLDGRVTNWNEGARRILGWTEEEMLGRRADAFFTPEDRAAGIADKEMEAAWKKGRGADERWHVRKDGERFFANGEMLTLRDEAGALIGFVKILRDRTEQRLSYERLEASEARLRDEREALRVSEERLSLALQASASLGWYDWDIPNDRLYASLGFSRMFGVDLAAAPAGLPIASYLEGVHPNDRDRVAVEIQVAMDGRTSFDAEYRLMPCDGFARWVHSLGRIHYDPAGRPTRFTGIVTDVTPRRLSALRQAAMAELGDRLRDTDDVPTMAYAAAELMARALSASRAGYGTVDVGAETALIEADWCAPGMPSVAGLHHFSEYGTFIEDLKRNHLVVIKDVTTDERTRANAQALLDLRIRSLVIVPLVEHGTLVALLFVDQERPHVWAEDDFAFVRDVADRTRAAIARVRADERQEVLNRELSHRMKNTFAMVQGIVGQTLRTASDVAEARLILEGRLVALGRAHDVLLAGTGETADLRTIVADGLRPHVDPGSDQVHLRGPRIEIGASAALALSLMVHELATNALKYGALSTAAGRIDATWSVDDGAGKPSLRLEWRERGGPEVTPPTRRGFGSRLIERGLTGAAGGKVSMVYDPGGVFCMLDVPVIGLMEGQ